MVRWMDFFAAANLVASSLRRAEDVAGGVHSDPRSLLRYVVIGVGGLSLLTAVAAAALYFWPGSDDSAPARTDSPASATPQTVEQPARTQQSYVEGISVEADVAARSVAVTSSFRGAEIVLFGAIDDTQFARIGNKPYDVVVAIQGREEPIMMRKKNNVAGMWINTESARFDHVPSFYAVSSTRPLEDIASSVTYRKHNIGIENILSRPTSEGNVLSQAEIKAYADALVRLKRESNLWVERGDGVSFTGRVLFRSSIDLPPSILVGTLVARVYLFSDQELMASFTSNIRMERQGMMLYMHRLAFTHQLWYGILAVILAAAAGLGASMVFRKSSH